MITQKALRGNSVKHCVGVAEDPVNHEALRVASLYFKCHIWDEIRVALMTRPLASLSRGIAKRLPESIIKDANWRGRHKAGDDEQRPRDASTRRAQQPANDAALPPAAEKKVTRKTVERISI
jgi:hypothetical protein